jgi:hypothetical protein
MKKYPRIKAIGKIGVTFVESVVSEDGSIFRAIPQDTDVGIDGLIEFVENEVATGTLVAVQIKAGESFLKQHSDDKYFSINASKADMNYWKTHTIPVALIAYDPVTKLSGWLDVTEYIRQHPERLEKENTTLTIHSRSNSFTPDSFRNKFKHTFTAYRAKADLFGSVNLMATLDNEKRFQGFLGLMSHQESRFSEITCYLLIDNLFDKNNKIRAAVTDALSRYLNHPEVGFFPPKEIREYVEHKLKFFGRNEIVNLLETCWQDEMLIAQRGSLGQCVGVIITNIPDYESHLTHIVFHNESEEKIRIAAIALAEEFGLGMIIENVIYNFDKTNWGNIREDVKGLVEYYAEFIHTPFITVLENAIENDYYDEDNIAYAIRDAGTPFLVFHEHLVDRIESRTVNPIVKFYAQRALHKIMKYKGQSTQDMLPGIEPNTNL